LFNASYLVINGLYTFFCFGKRCQRLKDLIESRLLKLNQTHTGLFVKSVRESPAFPPAILGKEGGKSNF